MEKQELLNFLMNNIDCFNNVSLEDFCLLNSLDSNELGFMNDRVSRVTPLLKQICDYALIAAIVNKEQLSQIAKCIDEDDTMLKESISMIENCFQYVQILEQENCHHPSILNMTALINGITEYSNFNDIIIELIRLINDEFQDNLIDFGTIVDDKLAAITDYFFDYFIDELENKIITNKKELLLGLSNYAINFFNTIMLIDNSSKKTNGIICFDDNYINIFKSNNKINQNFDLTIFKVLDSFATIVRKVENYEIENFYSIDTDVYELMEDLKKSYNLYQFYKYKILKDNYKETRLLEKCKKM